MCISVWDLNLLHAQLHFQNQCCFGSGDTLQAAQAQSEQEREAERNEWQQMLLERHETLQQEANGLQKAQEASVAAQQVHCSFFVEITMLQLAPIAGIH